MEGLAHSHSELCNNAAVCVPHVKFFSEYKCTFAHVVHYTTDIFYAQKDEFPATLKSMNKVYENIGQLARSNGYHL